MKEKIESKRELGKLSVLEKHGYICMDTIQPLSVRYFINPDTILEIINITKDITIAPINYRKYCFDDEELALYLAITSLNDGKLKEKEIANNSETSIRITFIAIIILEYFQVDNPCLENGLYRFNLKGNKIKYIIRYKNRIKKYNLFKNYSGICIKNAKGENKKTKVGNF